jgi:hypothetical protein
MPWASKYAARTAQLRTAAAALNRYQNRAWSRKADNLPDFDRQQQREQDRRDLKTAVEILEPIIGDRIRAEVALDRQETAEKADAAKVASRRAPGTAADPLEVFKAAVSDVLGTSPDSDTARRRVQQLLAIEATRLSFRR